MNEILDQSLPSIASALGDGRVTAEELVATAIARHGSGGTPLNAYKTWDPEAALGQAKAADEVRRKGFPIGPLHGIPLSVKDLYGVRGYPTFAGTAKRLPVKWEQEGFLVRSLRQQLAVVMGKTHTVELAFGGLGTNPHWGTPVNPWDATTHRVPGGSSCGAPVSLWEGSALIALGSDTAGSIRVPAALSGVVGHMTTQGRWPTDGLVPLSPTLDVVGGLTRSVEDAAYLFAAIDRQHGEPGRLLASLRRQDLLGLRIGIAHTRGWTEAQSDIAASAREALRELEARGARLVEVEAPELDAAFDLYASGLIVPPECAAFVASELPDWMELLDPTVGVRLKAASQTSASDYLGALSRRRELQRAFAARWRDIDVFASPTIPFTPPALAAVDQDLDEYMRQNRRLTYATNPVNVLGLCALTMPCGLDRAEMPVGLQWIGPGGEDERLLAIALAAERTLGTAVERLGLAPLGSVGQSAGRRGTSGPASSVEN